MAQTGLGKRVWCFSGRSQGQPKPSRSFRFAGDQPILDPTATLIRNVRVPAACPPDAASAISDRGN